MKTEVEQIRTLISEGKVNEAVKRLNEIRSEIPQPKLKNEITLLSSQQKTLNAEKRSNLLDANEISRRQNRLIHQMLEVITILESEPVALIVATEPKQVTSPKESSNNLSKILIPLAVILTVAAILVYVFWQPNDSTQNNLPETPTETTQPPAEEEETPPNPSPTTTEETTTPTEQPPQPVAKKPDLKITAFQMRPDTPVKGEKVSMQAVVKNIGQGDGKRFTVKWYAWEQFSQPAYTETFSALKAGEEKIFSFQYDGYPRTYASVTSKLVVDKENNNKESNEGNNILKKTYRVKRKVNVVVVPRPDLKITAFQMNPEVPVKGQKVYMQAIVKNVGTKNSQRFTVKWWAGENYPNPAFTKTFNGLAKGEQKVFSFQYDGYPSSYSSITSRLVVDFENTNRESNEENNTLKKTYRVKN